VPRLRSAAGDEAGVALVLALVIMVVLGALTAAITLEVAVNDRYAGQSGAADKAFALAELGLSYAEGRVYAAAAGHTTPSTAQSSFPQDGGTVTYWANVAADGVTWTMTGQGTYGGVTKTVSAQANVPSPVVTTDPSVWNYLYADDPSRCTTLQNNIVVAAPLFVRGSLCLSNNAAYLGTQLEIGGSLTIQNNAAVGSRSSPVGTLEVAGGSTSCNGAAPGTGTCDGTHSPIYARAVHGTLSVAEQKPPVDFANAYATTNPGPAPGHACQPGSGVPTPFFDDDGTLDDSLASVNLFPSTPYDCKVGSNEIQWTPSTSTLHVSGQFYFDGNLVASGNTKVTYTGSGTLYFTGTVSFQNNFQLCGIANCTSSWNPDTNGIIIVAGCYGDANGDLVNYWSGPWAGRYCFQVQNNAIVQIGAWVNTDYEVQNNAKNWGPVIANTLTFGNNTQTLTPFHTMPPGTPMNTQVTYLPASKPTHWSG